MIFKACGQSSGVKINELSSTVDGMPAAPQAGGFVGIGSWANTTARHIAFRHWLFLEGPDRLTRDVIEGIKDLLLVGCATAFTVRPLMVISISIEAQVISKSQMPWCTNW